MDNFMNGVVKWLVIIFGIMVVIGLGLKSGDLQAHGCGDKKVSISYNGKEFKTGHMMYNNRLFVPLRTVSTNLGAKVEWNSKDKTIGISNGDSFAQFKLGSKYVWMYGDDGITMDVEPMVIDGITFIPVRYAAEALGKYIEYYEDDVNRVVNITDIKLTQEVE
jgi:hypothetical protein